MVVLAKAFGRRGNFCLASPAECCGPANARQAPPLPHPTPLLPFQAGNENQDASARSPNMAGGGGCVLLPLATSQTLNSRCIPTFPDHLREGSQSWTLMRRYSAAFRIYLAHANFPLLCSLRHHKDIPWAGVGSEAMLGPRCSAPSYSCNESRHQKTGQETTTQA